jgi:hypothetical protein
MSPSAELAEVRLLAIPVDVYIRSQEHSEELMREFTLIAEQLAEGGLPPSHPVPVRLVRLIERLNAHYGEFSIAQEEELARAANDRRAVIDELVYRVPASVGDAARELDALLDEADEYCRAGQHLLTLATPPELVGFRRWFLGEFIEQVAGRAPLPWPEYRDAGEPATR